MVREAASEAGPGVPIDAETRALLQEMAACFTEPKPVVITPSPPVNDLDSLCAAFRNQPNVREHQTGCQWGASQSEQLWAMDLEPLTLETVTLMGLGAHIGKVKSSSPATDAELAALGLDRASVAMWKAAATREGVSRIERWTPIISDPYHGQPGLVVRTDIAFRQADGWAVCLDKPSPLLTTNQPVPPADVRCEPEPGTGERWWRCR